MATLLCFGLGYCARCYVDMFGARFERVIATVRDPGRGAVLATGGHSGRRIEVVVFDGINPSEKVAAAVDDADVLLSSIPPRETTDPLLEIHYGAIARASRLQDIVYLSSVGVYGDHGGRWVDESTQPRPVSLRTQARLAAEEAWLALGASGGHPVAVLRLAGIYGPGRNALVNLVAGTAKRIVKPGQVFNRIHVADIARAIDAAVTLRANGAFNVVDDEPGPPQDVVEFAAGLLGIPPPPPIAFGDAAKSMSSMALTFYGDNKQVANARLKTALGVTLSYPTYREGLRALFDAKDHLSARERAG